MKKIQSIVLSWLVGLLLVGNTLAQHLPRHVEVIPLTANCDWGIAPGAVGVVFASTDDGIADYHVGVTTDQGYTEALVSVCSSESLVFQEGNSGLEFEGALTLSRYGDEMVYAMALTEQPTGSIDYGEDNEIIYGMTAPEGSDEGTGSGAGSLASYSSGSWLDDYAEWFNGTFGSGWSETVGGAIHSVGSTVLEQETMANASDGAILTGTVIVSIPLAVGIVAGGEVVLGVGTFGGGASLIGSTAVVAPHLPAGTYPALVVDGTVYVARFHHVAWALAGRTGVETFYGFATVNAAGKVLELIK